MAPPSQLQVESSVAEDSRTSTTQLDRFPRGETRSNVFRPNRSAAAAPIDISDGDSTGPSPLTRLMARAGRISIIRQLMTGSSGSQVRVNPYDGNDSSSSAKSTGNDSLEKHAQKLDATVCAVAVSPNDKLYAAATISGGVIVCSVETGAIVDRFSIGTAAAIGAVVFLKPPGSIDRDLLLCVGSYAGEVHFRNVSRGETETIYEFGTEVEDKADAGHARGDEGSAQQTAQLVAGSKDRGDRTFKSHASVFALAASSKPQPPKCASRMSGPVTDTSALLAIGGKLRTPPDFVEVVCVTRPKPLVLNLAARGATDANLGHAPLQLARIARLQTIGTQTRSVSLDARGMLLAAASDVRVVQMWSLQRDHNAMDDMPSQLVESEFRCSTHLFSVSLSAPGDVLVVGGATHTEIYEVNTDPTASVHGLLDRELEYSISSKVKRPRTPGAPTPGRLSVRAVPPLSRFGSKLTSTGAVGAASNRSSVVEQSEGSRWSSRALYRSSSKDSVVSEVEESSHAADFQGHKRHGELFELVPLLFLPDCRCDLGGTAIACGVDGTGHILATAGGPHVKCIDLGSGSTLRSMNYGGASVARCVALSSDGRFVVSGHFDRSVRLQVLSTGNSVSIFSGGSSTAVVKCIALSADSSRLALGVEKRGKETLHLFDANEETLLHKWSHTAIEDCRFAPTMPMIGVAARCQPFTLFFTKPPYAVAHQLATFGVGASSEIPNLWRFAFSADGARVAVNSPDGEHMTVGIYGIECDATMKDQGAWVHTGSRDSSVGEVHAADATSTSADGDPGASVHEDKNASPTQSSCTVKLETKITSSALVYCTALDGSGEHCVLGGQARTVTMHRVGSPRSVQCWETQHTDAPRIFAVALTRDRQYCAFGGRGQSLCVANGLTGELLYTVHIGGTLMNLSLLDGAAGTSNPLLGLGGSFHSVLVLDLATQRVVTQLPADELTSAVSLTSASCAYAVGSCAYMFGKAAGRPSFKNRGHSREDQPSFDFLAHLVREAAAEQGELSEAGTAYASLELILAAHPAAVNARRGGGAAAGQYSRGTTLLQYALSFSNPRVLDLLLRPSECRIGLQADADGMTPLHAALEPGRQQLLQLLIRAMLQGRITLATPGATSVLENCYSKWAREYPKEFLAFVSRATLEPEPEVLGEGLSNVILPNGKIFALGSEHRCPLGLWDDYEKLDAYRTSKASRAAYHSEDSTEMPLKDRNQRVAQISMGFRTSALPGIRAMRLPIQNIAGFVPQFDGHDRRQTFLQVVVEAVEKTQDMQVLDSPCLEYLLKYKLKHRSPWRRMQSRLISILLIALYTNDIVLREMNLGYRLIALGLAFTIALVRMVRSVRSEAQQMRALGTRYWLMPLNFAQLLQPILFSLPLLPWLVWILGSASTSSFSGQGLALVRSIYFIQANAQGGDDGDSIVSPMLRAEDSELLADGPETPSWVAGLFWSFAARDCLTGYMIVDCVIKELQEIEEMRGSSLTVYLASKYNWLDQLMLVSMAVIIGCHLGERFGVEMYTHFDSTMLIFQGMLYVCQFCRLMDYMRGLKTFAVYVHLVLVVAADFLKFMAVTVTLWLGLALAVETQLEAALRQHCKSSTASGHLCNVTDLRWSQIDELEASEDGTPGTALARTDSYRIFSGSDADILLPGRLSKIWSIGFYGHENRATAMLVEEHAGLW